MSSRRRPKGDGSSSSKKSMAPDPSMISKTKFAPVRRLPYEPRAEIPDEEEVTGGPRVEPLNVGRAPVPAAVARSTGFRDRMALTGSLADAAKESGYKGALRRLTASAKQSYNDEFAKDNTKSAIPQLGDMILDEQSLRKIFISMDVNRNESLDPAEIKHLLAQLGHNLTDHEADNMISICDTRGDGAVTFEDFLAVFINPAEALRSIDLDRIHMSKGKAEVDLMGSKPRPRPTSAVSARSSQAGDGDSDGSGSSLDTRR